MPLAGFRAARADAGWRQTREQLELLADLIDAGVTIEDAFGTLARMSPDASISRAARTVAAWIASGGTVSGALREVGATTQTVAMVIGGERVGRVAAALRGAGDLEGRLEELRRTARRAALYPGVVLGIGTLMVTVIAVLVVPPLERTFAELGGALPLPTRVVLLFSSAVRSGVVLVVVLGALLLRHVVRAAFRTAGREGLARRVPLLGAFLRDVDMATAARIVATMLAAGAAFVDALGAAAAGLPRGPQRDRVEAARRTVERGGSAFEADGLGDALDAADLEILAVGERTGMLATQWGHVAERRSRALQDRVSHVGSVLEPLLVVLVGLIIGGSVLALYLPTFRVLDLL